MAPLKRLGFEEVRKKGSHLVLRRTTTTAVGTLYIELADRVSSSSEAVSDNLIVDFDELGKPVGVTLEHYSQISDTSTIETLLPITPVLQPA